MGELKSRIRARRRRLHDMVLWLLLQDGPVGYAEMQERYGVTKHRLWSDLSVLRKEMGIPISRSGGAAGEPALFWLRLDDFSPGPRFEADGGSDPRKRSEGDHDWLGGWDGF